MTRIDINLFSIVLLLIFLISLYNRKELSSFTSRAFKIIIYVTLIVLSFESLSFYVDGKQGDFFYIMNYATNFIVFLMGPLITAFWVSYIDMKIFGDYERLKNRFFYLHAFIIGVIILLVNLFTPIVFGIDKQNVYFRGDFIWINLLTTFLFLLYALYLSVYYRKQINKAILVSAVIFSFSPIVGAIIQLTRTGVVVLWASTTLAITFAYLLLETQSNSIDYLTGLFTRLKVDEYIRRLIRKDKEFAVIMIDLDDYKEINDQYGHLIGDQVIIKFGNVLKDVFQNIGLVARYGGDEFIIVMTEKETPIIKAYIKQVKERIKRSKDNQLSLVKFSSGISTRTLENNKSFKDLLIDSDNLMYKNKAINKNRKRRKTD